MLLPVLIALAPAPPPGDQQRRADQMRAAEARREGRMLSIKEIERRVTPSVPGAQYLGFDFDSESGIYTLKFLRDGAVIWIDVDGRSGQIVGRRGR